ncbi:MAG: hypothetical protein JWM44_1536 [Bacilli bacterium]|nr:hypothetical protein [Bacilli bacterium]
MSESSLKQQLNGKTLVRTEPLNELMIYTTTAVANMEIELERQSYYSVEVKLVLAVHTVQQRLINLVFGTGLRFDDTRSLDGTELWQWLTCIKVYLDRCEENAKQAGQDDTMLGRILQKQEELWRGIYTDFTNYLKENHP